MSSHDDDNLDFDFFDDDATRETPGAARAETPPRPSEAVETVAEGLGGPSFRRRTASRRSSA